MEIYLLEEFKDSLSTNTRFKERTVLNRKAVETSFIKDYAWIDTFNLLLHVVRSGLESLSCIFVLQRLKLGLEFSIKFLEES